jgi:uroporphyrinogen decarboxylase
VNRYRWRHRQPQGEQIMANPTRRELVLARLHGEDTALTPATLSMEGDVAARLDAHYGSQDWRQRVPLDIVRLSPFDSERRQPLDAAHDRDAFGTEWRRDLRPFHQEKAGLRAPTFAGYVFPSVEQFLDSERERQCREAIQTYSDRFRVIGFGFGLFERTWTIRGFEDSLADAVADPDFYDELVERIVQLHLRFVEISVTYPVDGVMFSDDWGDQRGVILGPERWRRFIKPRLARLYEHVHRAGKFALSHCCGSVIDILPDIVEIGLDVLESVQPEARGMNPYELKKKFGNSITFWGGLGSQSTIPFGTPERISSEVDRLCAHLGRGGRYILSPAKALQPETPTANAAILVEAFTRHAFER